MYTPRDRYLNDPQFKSLVDMMEAHIHQANFTPSEMREAAVLASIKYEMRRINDYAVTKDVENALKTLNKYTIKEPK